MNFDVALVVDGAVDYTCATNAGGQYCAIAQLQNISDVCANIILIQYCMYIVIGAPWMILTV